MGKSTGTSVAGLTKKIMGKSTATAPESEAAPESEIVSESETAPESEIVSESEGITATHLTKLTVATCYGKVDVDTLPETGTAPLVRIGGYAQGVKTGISNYGPWSALIGEFSAQNKDGELFAAKACLIPGPMGDALITAVETELAKGGKPRVGFLVEIHVQRMVSNPKKYQYVVKSIMAPKIASPSMALLRLM